MYIPEARGISVQVRHLIRDSLSCSGKELGSEDGRRLEAVQAGVRCEPHARSSTGEKPIMSETDKAQNTLNDRPFSEMNPREKVVFLVKMVVFFVSGGFIFPTLWVD